MLTLKHYLLAFASFIFLFIGCNSNEKDHKQKLFTLVNEKDSGFDFTNKVENSDKFNIFSYRNFYNGGGVGIGDLNNDGLSDIVMTSNMSENQIFLNKGNFTFENISSKSGIANDVRWSTGVVLVDINGDSYLDIYICNAGYQDGSKQENQLFINNGDLTFTDQAKEYGLDDAGYTTHASFFDYDKDGDLDVYLLNNSFIPVNTLNYSNNRELRAANWPVKDFLQGGGDKLLKNENGKFIDVSEKANIYGSLIGFGLGVSTGDVNNDGWPDIYVSNDFYERDYLYLNQKDGTFKENLIDQIQSTSMSSMGSDFGDINNDGNIDIITTDMLPYSDKRLKTTTNFEGMDIFKLKKERGFHNQFMKNALQLNNGNGSFSEISNYAGVSASDWSWGALFIDGDNDGLQDIFVSNGIYKDVIDQDFIDFFADEVIQKMTLTGKKEEVEKVVAKMPSTPIVNCYFKNLGNNIFENTANMNGLDLATFSNGAAYGDLDNDGDLDLVVNNVNQPSLLYRNDSKNNFLSVKVIDTIATTNTYCIGSKIILHSQNRKQVREIYPSRGFQSSVDYVQIFGIGNETSIDSLEIIYPDGNSYIIVKPAINSKLTINKSSATLAKQLVKFDNEFEIKEINIPFVKHEEDGFDDYHLERNICELLSNQGPCIAVGDLNSDGLDDIFIGGALYQEPQLLISNNGAYFRDTTMLPKMSDFEDTAASFFDIDGDGDLDLYVGSGGNFQPLNTREMQDRVYENIGGKFKLKPEALPNNGMNTSVTAPYDFDNDGDIDIFVGSRSYPLNYGKIPTNYLYVNNGKGVFKIEEITDFDNIKMVTDAKWVNIDGSPEKELIVVGEYMPVCIFKVYKNTLKFVPSNISNVTGSFRHINLVDFDKDGRTDILAGNLGLNFYTKDHLTKLYYGDFDDNGSFDRICTYVQNNKDLPIIMKKDMVDMLPNLKKKILTHQNYAEKDISTLIGSALKNKTLVYESKTKKTMLFRNSGDFKFEEIDLPYQIQYSCVNTSIIFDSNGDGFDDIIIAGNSDSFLPQYGNLMNNNGQILINEKGKSYKLSPNVFNIKGVANSSAIINKNNNPIFIFGMNNNFPKSYKLISNDQKLVQ